MDSINVFGLNIGSWIKLGILKQLRRDMVAAVTCFRQVGTGPAVGDEDVEDLEVQCVKTKSS